MILLPSVLLILLAAAAPAQLPDEIAAWRPPSGETTTSPQAACSSLRELTGFEFTIIAASPVPASTERPEFCRVLGLIQPEIRFEVALPAQWHGRLIMVGNGGYAGEDLEAPQRARSRDAAIAGGFAFTQTNTGHSAAGEPLGAFGAHPQKLLDYAFRAVHVTAITARKVAAAYYGAPPKRAYFFGCSTGGRQALIAAQRFPQDFDGIVAGAPVLDFAGTMLNYVPVVKALEAAPVPVEKLKRAGDTIYSRCDVKDGVRDGVIDDPRQCDFEPSLHLTRCVGPEAPDCFTEGQIRALETLYKDQFIGGRRVFPGWPVGAETAGGDGRLGWDRWLLNQGGPPIFALFAEAFFRYVAVPERSPELGVSDVDVEQTAARMESIRQTLNASDTDLSAFRKRGGKLLMWFGWADPALNPRMGLEYYESVTARMGPATRDFFRLFLFPGVFHCGGGPGCDAAPRLASVIDWAERGQAPDQMTAMRRVSGKVVRTRPVCAYPAVAKYKGSGSTDEAESFTCATH